jgi:hypothetical protein
MGGGREVLVFVWRELWGGDTVQGMRRSRGRTSAVVTLLLACARPGGSPTPAASPLTLKIVLTKPESFEGEPIYALFELRNVSSDTVRIPPFGFNSSWLVGVLHRADGSVVPGGRSAWIDYMCHQSCNDDPVAPGGARYFPFIAQEFWGEPGPFSYTTLYRNLETGAYALDGSFRLDGPAGSTPVVASPVVFRVRSRRPAEEAAYQQFVRLLAVDVRAWTVADLDSALAWMSRRLAADNADPFALEVLIWSDSRTAVHLHVDSTEWARIFQVELAIVKGQAASTAGAYAAAHLYGRGWPKNRDPRLPLCPTLAGTVAGDIACEREASWARMEKSSPPD